MTPRSRAPQRLWADGSQSVNLAPDLDRVWSYEKRFCCEQLFRDQKSGVFHLAGSGLREPERIDRLLLVVAITVLAGSLQGYALSLAGLRRQVDPHWKRGMSFLRIGLAALQMAVADAATRLMDWRVAHPAAQAAVGQRLEEADQISCSSRVLERRGQRWEEKT